MIKLLKYDFRRSANLLIGAMVLLILFETFVLFIPNADFKLWLGTVGFFFAAVYFFIATLRNYDYNIKSISRRALPVSPLAYVGAPIIFGCTGFALLALIGLSAGLIYTASVYPDVMQAVFKIPILDKVGMLLIGLWSLIYGLIFIFLAITISRSIASRGNLWIGLIVLFGISNVMDWLERSLFKKPALYSSPEKIIPANTKELLDRLASVNGSTTIGQLIFEIVTAAVIVYIMKLCIERYVDAR